MSQALSALLFFAALVFWEGMLRTVMGIEGLTTYPLLFLLAVGFLCAFFTGWLNKPLSRVCSFILLTALLIYYGAQMIYFRIFGSAFSISMIGLGGDAIANFSRGLFYTMLNSVWWLLLFCLPLILYGLVLIIKKPAFSPAGVLPHFVSLAAAAGLWLLATAALTLGGTGRYTAYDAYHNPHTGTDTAIQHLGALPTSAVELFGGAPQENEETIAAPTAPRPQTFTPPVEETEGEKPLDTSPNIIEEIDFTQLAAQTEDERIKALCEYFAATEGTDRNEYTGLLEGYNLIYICAEAFSSAAIHPEVTPTLYMLANNGIVLENYYNSFMNTTTNGEFAFMTGLWPDMSRAADDGRYTGSFSQSADNYMPFGLGNILGAQGYGSYAFHNYLGSYYNRSASHANLGYTCRFMEDGMSFTYEWPASDLELMEQTVDDFIDDDKFNVYYMTFSGHGPYSYENDVAYNNVDEVMGIIGSTTYGEAEYYLAANLELEYAMQYLMGRLEEAGKADNTLIVLTGDHYPYYMNKWNYDRLMGAEEIGSFSYYESTCIMWCGGLEENIYCDSYCCNVDILPTVLNLLGVEYDSRLLAGRDVFADTDHYAMMYNHSFATEYVLLNTASGKTDWQVDVSQTDDAALREYLDYTTAVLETRYAISLEIMDTDFYRFVWENSGLMPPDYVPPAKPEEGGAQ